MTPRSGAALSSVGVLAAALALIQVMSTLGTWSTDAGALSTTDATEPTDPVDVGTVTTRVDHLEAVAPEPVPRRETVSVDSTSDASSPLRSASPQRSFYGCAGHHSVKGG